MHGKVALVTGGGGGIGAAAAMEFARRGAAVAVADLSLEAAEKIAARLRDDGARALAIRADVTSEEDVRDMVARTVDEFRRCDFAFNNAGILGPMGIPLHVLEEPDWNDVLDTNLKSVWLSMKHEIAFMLEHGGGVIVNNASVVGLRAATFNPAYGASKHGVVGLTRAAASYYGEYGIRVNAVCPGVVLTAMTGVADAQPDSPSSRRIERTPLRRGGEAAEIARVAAWLCSEEASYLTGVALPIDGGLSVNA